MRFMLKAGLIEAVQYRRDENIHEVQYFFEINKDNGKKLRYQPVLNEYAVVITDPFDRKKTALHILRVGEYIIRHIDGTYEVMAETTFKKDYDRISWSI